MVFISTSLVNISFHSLHGCKNSTWNKIKLHSAACLLEIIEVFLFFCLGIIAGTLRSEKAFFLSHVFSSFSLSEAVRWMSHSNKRAFKPLVCIAPVDLFLYCTSVCLRPVSLLAAASVCSCLFFCALVSLPSSCTANYLPARLSVDPHAFPRA